MININGYYLTEGIPFDERKDLGNEWYLFVAYRFFINGTFIKASKFSKEKDFAKFEPLDFNEENTAFYEFKNGQLVLHFHKGMPWEESEHLIEKGNEEFEMKTGTRIKFIPW